MVKISIVIKTKDRSPRKNYLRETISNLCRAGIETSEHLAFIMVCDSGSSLQFLDENNTWSRANIDTAKRTLQQNAQRAIELASSGTHDYAMVIEDDLDFCDNFLENVVSWLDDFEVDHPQMFALGANYAQIKRVAEMGGHAWAYPVTAFYGAQALVWKREVAATLAAWLGPDPVYNGIRDHGHDLLLQTWGKQVAKVETFVASAPCMVQHIGEESGINNRFFQFPWGGRDWKYARRAA